MKRRVLVQVDEGTHSAWKQRAFTEGRSMSDLARVLIERAVLTEREPEKEGLGNGAVVSPALATPARSVSAAVTPEAHDGVVRARPHMRRNRPAVECPTRWPTGVCPDCGTVV